MRYELIGAATVWEVPVRNPLGLLDKSSERRLPQSICTGVGEPFDAQFALKLIF
jgi:hypothetical protein